MSWYSYRPYVSAAERSAKAQKKIKSMESQGLVIQPLGGLTNRMKISTSFWGRAWCNHLETYSDYENRLPRGRTYVRNGSVLHLAIEHGKVEALVQGSELYKETIRIDPLPEKKWKAIQARCRGRVGSLIELLQGKISDEIMTIVTDKEEGLFPSPREIHLDCSCPDWAEMCKHVAAVLYGVGARFDSAPELLFKLRGVDHADLISADASAAALGTGSSRRRTLDESSLSEVFGIELDTPPVPPKVLQPKPSGKPKAVPASRPVKTKKSAAPAKKSAPVQFLPAAASIRKLRADLNLTKAALASKIGVSATTISNWESKRGSLALQNGPLKRLHRLHRTTLKK